MTDIAVVIPFYDLGRYVDEALESVVRQSRPPAEVLILDDGSPDLYSREVLARIERQGTRVVYGHHEGLSSARNRGIRLTSAEYLVTLDADDRLDADYVARTAARLDDDADLGFVSTGIQAFGEAAYSWTPPPCTIENVLLRGAPHPASLFRRTVWTAIGGFDPLFQACEDLDFWLSALELGFRGDVIDEPLLWYRVRSSSMHQRSVSAGKELHHREQILRKHRATVERIGPDLVLGKERFLVEQHAYERMRDERQNALYSELETAGGRIHRARAELARAGAAPLDWGELRAEPFTGVDSPDRGVAIGARFVSSFLARHAADRRGAVLEIGTASEPAGSGRATRLIAELPGVPSASADCVVVAQALRSAFDVRGAIEHLARILKPGGVLLCALPATRAATGTASDDSDFWRFTQAAVRRLFAGVFPPESVEVTGYGNVMVCAAALAGLAADELDAAERDFVDPMFPLTYCVRCVKR